MIMIQYIKQKNIFRNTRDIKGLINKLPPYAVVENSVASHLARDNAINDYPGAIGKINRHLRLMYVHAVQSLIWNHIASERIDKYGMNVIVGDLVKVSDNYKRYKHKFSESNEYNMNDDIKIVTIDDVKNNIYNIYDVVIPNPGADVIYPNNDINDSYKKYFKEYDISFDNLSNRSKKDYLLTGDYRKLLIKPEHFNYEIGTYNDLNIPFTEDDLTKLEKNNLPITLEEMNNVNPIRIDKNEQYKAIKLEFVLPSSCYATMCIREITKNATTIKSQINMSERKENKYSKNFFIL